MSDLAKAMGWGVAPARSTDVASRVYRVGDLRSSGPEPSDCWSWLSAKRLSQIAQLAYRTAQESCIPDSEPFVQDGLPYSDAFAFADVLVEEFKALVYLRLGTPLSGINHGLLSDPKAVQVAVFARGNGRGRPPALPFAGPKKAKRQRVADAGASVHKPTKKESNHGIRKV